MLEYDRTELSKGIDVNKTDGLYNCIICHYWYFLEINLGFQPKVCDGCHDLMQKAVSFIDVAIVFLKENCYLIYFWYINKDEAINLLRNANLTEKAEHYKT